MFAIARKLLWEITQEINRNLVKMLWMEDFETKRETSCVFRRAGFVKMHKCFCFHFQISSQMKGVKGAFSFFNKHCESIIVEFFFFQLPKVQIHSNKSLYIIIYFEDFLKQKYRQRKVSTSIKGEFYDVIFNSRQEKAQHIHMAMQLMLPKKPCSSIK